MKKLIALGLAASIASLVMHISSFTNMVVFWDDTAKHQSISLIIVFIALTVFGYLAFSKYIGGYGRSKIVLPAAVILLFLVIAIGTLNIDVFIALPKAVVSYADMWYALPGAVGIFLLTLFGLKRF